LAANFFGVDAASVRAVLWRYWQTSSALRQSPCGSWAFGVWHHISGSPKAIPFRSGNDAID
jgi:hypothetical protein